MDVKKFNFELEGTSPILMHKFNGLTEEKQIKQLADSEQAEKHAYRNADGHLSVPASCIRGSIINAFINNAGNKEKTNTKLRVSPRVQIAPFYLDTGLIDFAVDKRSVPAGSMSRGGTRDMCVRPLIETWAVKGVLQTTLRESDDDIRRMFEVAGVDVGVGSNRINGYGRYAVTTFEKL